MCIVPSKANDVMSKISDRAKANNSSVGTPARQRAIAVKIWHGISTAMGMNPDFIAISYTLE